MHLLRRVFSTTLFLFLITGSTFAQRMPQDSWYFSHKWGSSGTGTGQFNSPGGVSIAPDGQVFVTDTWNRRIQVFDQAGTFIRQWGSSGTGAGQFNSPSGVAIAPDGQVFVADRGNNRIQVFEPDGTFVRKWGSAGTAPGQFSSPYGVAISPAEQVIVADSANSRIQVFEQDGTFVRKWGSAGTLDGQFDTPRGVAVSQDGRVIVADLRNDRIQMFESDGTFIRKWRTATWPRGVAVAPDGNIIVSYGHEGGSGPRQHVRVFNVEGTLLRDWGTTGAGDQEFFRPVDIDVCADGSLIIADYGNHRVQMFRQAGYRLAPQLGDVPLPQVINTAQRPGTPYLDVDYVVWDSDSPAVKVAAAAFKDGVDSLNNFIKISAFVDGTESMVGEDIPVNVTKSFTWNVAADWQADYVNLKVRMMAQDERQGLMSVGFITLPEDEENSLPELTISQSPITQSDMLPLWYWLLANDDPDIRLENGRVVTDADLSGGGLFGPSGLVAEYFNNRTFEGDPLIVLDDTVDFSTAGGNWPYSPLSPTNFSVRWTGVVVPESTENYTFSARYLRGGVRLWVNSELLVDRADSTLSGWASRSANIDLEAGIPYDIVMEYRYTVSEGDGGVELRWSSPSVSQQIIPAERYLNHEAGLLAYGRWTTWAGREFLFSRMGVRRAKVDELARARTGPAGVVNQWSPRISVGPGDRPKAVNEYGFDTGNWGADGWWVVPE